MRDNNKLWNKLLDEANEYPEGLLTLEERLEERLEKPGGHGSGRRKGLIRSLTAAAASLTFILLVNFSPAFGETVAGIPVLGEIAEFVRLDRALSNAIRNDYVQELGLEAWDGDTRLLLPYVIADEKNLILFFQLPRELEQGADEWVSVHTTGMTNAESGEKVTGYSYTTGDQSREGREENFGFIKHDYQFVDESVPKHIELEVELKSAESVLGTFAFQLELAEFSAPKVHTINEKHTVLGQEILIKDISVYPTGTELNVTFDEGNSALIKGLELFLNQSDGTTLKGTQDGISATYDDTWMRLFIESNYFETPEKQELEIRGARLLDKDEVFITVDMDRKTLTPAIAGTELVEVIREGDRASLVFASARAEDDLYSLFATEYTDEAGNPLEMDGLGTGTEQNAMNTYLTVKYPDNGRIILKRQLAPMTYFDRPVIIPLPAE